MSAPSRLPLSSTADTPNPRKRGRTACTRCKNRKQKCDNTWPICSNCRKAGTECDKTTVTEDEPPAAYTRALEERVAFLESRLAGLSKDSGRGINEPTAATQQERRSPHPSSTTPSPRSNSNNSPNKDENNNALREIVELLSLGNFEAPAYIGSSSGLHLALNLGEMVQATVWNKALPHTVNNNNNNNGRGSSNNSSDSSTRGRAITMEELVSNSAGPPGDDLGTSIIDAYFNQLHSRYPFLDPDQVWRLHGDRMVLASTPIQNLTKAQRFGIFKLYMVYAIGAMLLQLTEKHGMSSSPSPESYYMSALQHILAARESRTTQNIEAMLLLVVYHLRSPSSFGLWYMIGLAMRTSIDLGLHRKATETNYDAFTVQMRRRLFWSVYSLERNVAISMGRPFSIADRQIDAELPNDDHGIIIGGDGDATTAADSTTPSTSPGTTTRQKYTLTQAICLFKLRRIESRIQDSIYRIDKPLSSLLPKLDPLYHLLTSWKSELEQALPQVSDRVYAMLHYHRAVRLLLQPFLALLTPSDAYFQLCLRAAGDICQAHKRLHQTLDYGHSFIAVQTVFVAGITLLYALWTRANEVWSVGLANDVRACSLVLFVMGERASWVRKYRDAFELLVGAAMDKLQRGEDGVGESSSTQTSTKLTQELDASNLAFEGAEDGEQQEAWRVVAELASWIDQDPGSPAWMPDFEPLRAVSRQGINYHNMMG